MIRFIKEGLISKLDNIQRFNGHFSLHRESVATHSYWVVFYANLLFRDLFYMAFQDAKAELVHHGEEGSYWNFQSLYPSLYNFTIRQAIMHDVDEVFCSDILHDVKYHEDGGDEIRKGLRGIIKSGIDALPSSVLKLELLALQSSDSNYGTTHLCVEHKVVAHNIVKICDWLSSYHYCHQEVSVGNPSFNHILQRCIDGLRTCRVSLLKALEDSKLPYSPSTLENIL